MNQAFTIDTNGAVKVASSQSGTWAVTGAGGTFPVTDSGGSLTVDNAALSVTGGGVEASALRVTLASDSTGLVSVDDNGGSLTVDAPVGTPVFVRLSDGASAIATLPVSAASLPLPTGAATAAKQPALGTAGTASADVLTVQGIASMTALKVDGSAVTQPVSLASAVTVQDGGGTVTVDAPVGTPVFVRLSDGAAAISTLPVSLASVPTHAVTQSGTWTVDTELPAASTLADATANASVPAIGMFAHIYNGTTWDRVRGDTTNGIDVDVTRVTGTVTVDSELPVAAALADGASNPTAPAVGASNLVWNGSTWDRQPGTVEGTALASGTRNTTTTSSTITNYGCRGVAIYLNITSYGGGAGLSSLRVVAVDPISAATNDWFISSSITSSGLKLFYVYPGASGGSATGAALPLPRTWKVTVVHGDGNNHTYSVGYCLIP